MTIDRHSRQGLRHQVWEMARLSDNRRVTKE